MDNLATKTDILLSGKSRPVDLSISASLLCLAAGFLPYPMDKADAIFIM